MSAQLSYKTLRAENSAEFVINKSRFIGYGCPCETEEEALAFLARIRQKHKDATHNCYAYIIGLNSGIMRYSDDGEPGGTAGVPIYEVLRKEGLTDVCCVVTRYFGGILLGAGGLVRAYTKGVKDAVDVAQIKCMAAAVRLAVTVDYGFYGKLAQVFADFDARVENEEFADNVCITLCIREENSAALADKLIDTCNGNITINEVEKLNFDFA